MALCIGKDTAIVIFFICIVWMFRVRCNSIDEPALNVHRCRRFVIFTENVR